jgi:hypothetical protein
MGASGRGDGSTVGTVVLLLLLLLGGTGTGAAWGSSTGIQYGTASSWRLVGLLCPVGTTVGGTESSIGRVVGAAAAAASSLESACCAAAAASTTTTWSMRVGTIVTGGWGRLVVGHRVGDGGVGVDGIGRGGGFGREVGVVLVGTVGGDGTDSIDLARGALVLGDAEGVSLCGARVASSRLVRLSTGNSGGMIQMASTLVAATAAADEDCIVAIPTQSSIRITVRHGPIIVGQRPRVQDVAVLLGAIEVVAAAEVSGSGNHGGLVVGAAAAAMLLLLLLLLLLLGNVGFDWDTVSLSLVTPHCRTSFGHARH